MEQSDVFRFSFINDRLGIGYIDTVAICEDAKKQRKSAANAPWQPDAHPFLARCASSYKQIFI